jgi:hypothetical protein
VLQRSDAGSDGGAWRFCPIVHNRFMRSSIPLTLLLTAVSTAPGCERTAPSSSPSEASVEAVPAENPAGEIQHTYVGAGDGSEDDDDADEGEDVDESTPNDDELTAEAAVALVTAALDEVLDPYAARIVTPALPPSWPLEGSAVVYLVYPLTPVPRGVDRYQTSAPSHRVELDVRTREAAVETVEKPKKLGDYERPRPKRDDPISKAEQALLEVAAAPREAEKVHYLLAGYEQWFEANGTIGADARKRVSAFASWASSWGR